MSISKLPTYNWTGTFSGEDRRNLSNFDSMMANNSTPTRGEVISIGPYKQSAYYRNQNVPTTATLTDLQRSDLGLDDQGNQIDLEALNLPDAPIYTAPEVDQAGINKYTQSNLAPMLSKLRQALNRNIVTNKNVDNVNVRKELTRGAMSGYGEGLSSAASSARKSGTADYMNIEYNPALEAARTNYQTSVNKYNTGITDMLNRRRAALAAYGG